MENKDLSEEIKELLKLKSDKTFDEILSKNSKNQSICGSHTKYVGQ